MKRRSLLSMGGGSFETPFDMLSGCHQRIRMFCDLAQRLPAQPAPAEEVAEAASRLCLYFGTALPLHEQDEEDTLHRAMQAAGAPGMDALFARLRKEHRTIEEVLQELLPRWESLKESPELLAAEKEKLGQDAEALAAAFAPHLDMEENELYPLARRVLSADVLADMLRAMRARREPVIGKLTSLHGTLVQGP